MGRQSGHRSLRLQPSSAGRLALPPPPALSPPPAGGGVDPLAPGPLPRSDEVLHQPGGARLILPHPSMNRKERCEVLVIGSGPGGAVTAWTLASHGKDVLL